MAEDLILLSTEEGQKLLSEAKQDQIYQDRLYNVFRKQVGRSNCGIQSSAMVLAANHLNSINHDGPVNDELHSSLPYTEKKMFTYKQVTDVVIDEEHVTGKGLTLEQLYKLLQGFRPLCEVTAYYAEESSIEEFRKVAIDVLSDSSSRKSIIVNYHMGVLGQGTVYGHFSPLGAYHKTTDRFLILDTWYDTVEPWAKTDKLFTAMKDVDSDSRRCRGFIVVDFDK